MDYCFFVFFTFYYYYVFICSDPFQWDFNWNKMSERDVQIHANLLAEYVYAHVFEYFKHSNGLHKCHSLLIV